MVCLLVSLGFFSVLLGFVLESILVDECLVVFVTSPPAPRLYIGASATDRNGAPSPTIKRFAISLDFAGSFA